MYKIGRRVRTSFIDEHDLTTDGYRVFFVMDDGTADYIEIARQQYNAENVHEAIEAAIARHHALTPD